MKPMRDENVVSFLTGNPECLRKLRLDLAVKRRSVPYPVSRVSVIESERGVALLLILWVLFLLAVISAEFAFSMRTDFAITINFKEEIEAYYMARAGISQAIVEILKEKIDYNERQRRKRLGETEEEIEEVPLPEELPKDLGSGSLEYRKIDEETKININSLRNNRANNREILKRLLQEAADVTDESTQDTIIDSIMDWMDPDDLFKPAGAEEDYYQGLSPSYHCKNGPFDTVEELLLVQGMTREILFGSSFSEQESGETYPGIGTYLTVWTGGRFNRSVAEEIALRAKLGEEAADKEMERRLKEEESPSELEKKEKPPPSHWSIEAVGNPAGGGSKRTIKAAIRVVTDKKKKTPTVKFLFWDDNYINRFVSYKESEEGEETEYE